MLNVESIILFSPNAPLSRVRRVRENDQSFRIFYQYETLGSLPYQRVQKKTIRRSI